MPSLKKLLSFDRDKEVITGEVIQRQTDRMYQVKIGKRVLSMQSLVSERLPRNSQVVVVKTDEGYYITNKEQIKDRQKREVTISG
jgi:hypothetical protein